MYVVVYHDDDDDESLYCEDPGVNRHSVYFWYVYAVPSRAILNKYMLLLLLLLLNLRGATLYVKSLKIVCITSVFPFVICSHYITLGYGATPQPMNP